MNSAKTEKPKPVKITVDGKLRIIRNVLRNDSDGFEAWYKGCHIHIYKMHQEPFPPYNRLRWGLDVAAETGCLIVDTYYYDHETTREKMLKEALRNIWL